jgi:hypothetical protein
MRPSALSIQHPPYDQPAGRLVAVPVPPVVDLVDTVVLGWMEGVVVVVVVAELLATLLALEPTVPVKTVKRSGPPQGSTVLPEHGISQLASGCWIDPPCRVLSQTSGEDIRLVIGHGHNSLFEHTALTGVFGASDSKALADAKMNAGLVRQSRPISFISAI